MNPPNENNYESLKELVDEPKKHKEKECREFIRYALELFVPVTGVTTILEEESEYPGHTGPNDLIVFCEHNSGGIKEKHAYIWEVKSPQTPVFIEDSKSRVKPSPGFVKAENQLLHYWEDCKNEQFRAKFEITDLDCINLGGILIAKRDNLVSGNYEDSKKKQLYKTAINLRKKCLYSSTNIKVLIWDDILDFIRLPTNNTKDKHGDIGTVTISGNQQPEIIIGGSSI